MRDFISRGDTEHSVESLRRLITEANALALAGCRANMRLKCRSNSTRRRIDVFVDRIQIQQVLFNLTRNAIEAMIDSPIRSLTISSTRRPGRVRHGQHRGHGFRN